MTVLTIKPIKCCATCIHYWNCSKEHKCKNNHWKYWERRMKDMKCKYNGIDYNDCPNLSYKEVNGYYETHICLLTRETCSKYEKEINKRKQSNS